MKPATVAVIENDPNMLAALSRLLTAHGFRVAGFNSAEAFLGARDAVGVSCLVLDIQLDGMSGIELGQKMVGDGRAIPIIFITAFDAPRSKAAASAIGYVAYLLKPFASTDLIEAIGQVSRP
jgi:FixJ family two-component response regulator